MGLFPIVAVLGVAWISLVVVILTLCKAASQADAAYDAAIERAGSGRTPAASARPALF